MADGSAASADAVNGLAPKEGETTTTTEDTTKTTTGSEGDGSTEGTGEKAGAEGAGGDGETGKGEGEGGDKSTKPKRKGGFQRRIERAEAEAAYWRARAEGKGQDNTGTTGKPAKPDTSGDKPPKLEDFESYEDYLKATVRYDLKQEQAKESTTRQRQEAEQRFTEAVQEFRNGEAIEKAREKYDDFDEVVFDPSVPINQAMMQAIVGSEAGHDIAYYLGSNPAEARKIARMSALDAARAIGRIEAKLSSAPAPKTTAAKPPPKTVSTKSTSTGDNWEGMSVEEMQKRLNIKGSGAR